MPGRGFQRVRLETRPVGGGQASGEAYEKPLRAVVGAKQHHGGE
jgi:hypothetical protein